MSVSADVVSTIIKKKSFGGALKHLTDLYSCIHSERRTVDLELFVFLKVLLPGLVVILRLLSKASEVSTSMSSFTSLLC